MIITKLIKFLKRIFASIINKCKDLVIVPFIKKYSIEAASKKSNINNISVSYKYYFIYNYNYKFYYFLFNM